MINKILNKNNGIKIVIFVLSLAMLISLDQLSKQLVTKYLANGNTIIVIPDIFELFYLENRGAAFGILQGQRELFFIITIVVLLVLIVFLFRLPYQSKYVPLYIVLVLIFSGAMGNFIDRITKGYVVDFLYFKPINFPLFNVADSYITVACFLLLYLILFYYKEEELKF